MPIPGFRNWKCPGAGLPLPTHVSLEVKVLPGCQNVSFKAAARAISKDCHMLATVVTPLPWKEASTWSHSLLFLTEFKREAQLMPAASGISSAQENLLSAGGGSSARTLNGAIHHSRPVSLRLAFFSPKHNFPLFGKKSILFPVLFRECQIGSKGLCKPL